MIKRILKIMGCALVCAAMMTAQADARDNHGRHGGAGASRSSNQSRPSGPSASRPSASNNRPQARPQSSGNNGNGVGKQTMQATRPAQRPQQQQQKQQQQQQQQQRPSDNKQHAGQRPGAGSNNRPQGNGHQQQQQQQKPQHQQQPQHQQRPNNNGRPGNNGYGRPHGNGRPNNNGNCRPHGPGRPNYSNYAGVPYGGFGWHRPTPPPRWRPTRGLPVVPTLVGLAFGTAINVAEAYLLANNIPYAAYGNGMMYVNNVPYLDFVWPEARLIYNTAGLLAGSQMFYSAPYYDPDVYNMMYNRLNAIYGAPVTSTMLSSGYSNTWFGAGQGFITLTFQPMLGYDGRTHFYTTLSIGN